jgi:hypothetical protein
MTIALARTRIKSMNNSQLQLKDLSEKNAKALATSVTKFLAAQGITLQHTKALDLAGTICGFGDWHGLQAAVSRKEAEEAATPIKMSYEDFVEKFKPVKNTLCAHANADGFAFAVTGSEYAAVLAAFERNPGTVWTCTHGDGTMWITEGIHRFNREFYLITKKPAQDGRFYEIPYGHDEGDLCFEVSVMNPQTRVSELIDTIYDSSAEDAFERAGIDLEDEIEGIVEEGQSRVIIVKQVPA